METHRPGPSVFTIASILGLSRSEQRSTVAVPYRPWTDVPSTQSCPSVSKDRALDSEDETSSVNAPVETCRRALNWYIGRRPRTAFSSLQIEILESVFQVNSYPGIDLREELAQKLHLDEDRIQIWFQNRRAKMKRTHRESQFLLVKKVITGLHTRDPQ
ncbi:homeobox expressed in ES cells 1 [Hoplias malabaricus]|uniref:homeobox expressed in ES cells 1 n=1 Tax=Hoplias malabaricus TaxID=27720 RepID=UPI003461F433